MRNTVAISRNPIRLIALIALVPQSISHRALIFPKSCFPQQTEGKRDSTTFKRIFLFLGLTVACLAYQNSVLAQGNGTNFSLPVTGDSGGYRKFDSKAVAGKLHTGDDYYNLDLKALAANCGVVVKKIINGQSDHGFGNTVIIRHDLTSGSVYSLYGHLASFAPGIEPNKSVSRGQLIGTMGSTGSGSNGIVHLHFEIKRGPTLANPSAFGSKVAESLYGYVLIDAGTSKATSATDYGYIKPSSFYGGYQASCGANPVLGQPKAVVSTSLRLSQGNGPFGIGTKLDGSFSITNRGTADLVMKNVLIGGRVGGPCAKDVCPADFVPPPPYRDITLAPGQKHDYSGTFTTQRLGLHTFSVAYQKADGNWVVPVDSENGTVNKLDIMVQSSGPTLTGISPASFFASSLPRTVSLVGTGLANTISCQIQLPNGTRAVYWFLPWEIFSRKNNQLGAKIKFPSRGTYYISAKTKDGLESNALKVVVN